MKIIRNFIRCGLLGWLLEVIYTGLGSLLRQDYSLMSHTSLLMFPIYGFAVLIHPMSRIFSKWNMFVRGFFYMLGIFSMEYLSGNFLRKRGICPWDYSQCATNVDGVIRLDFAPLWFGTGLLFERVMREF